MDIKERKANLRKEVKKIEESIDLKEKKEWDEKILRSFSSIPEYEKSQKIFIFASLPNEPDTLKIIEKMLEDNKFLYLPKCLSKGIMKAFRIHSLSELKTGKYGILEPSDESDEIRAQDIDLAFVPSLAVDKELNRLGHGGGYYDRFLKSTACKKVLISYEAYVLSSVPTESHDISCDYLITEKKIYHR